MKKVARAYEETLRAVDEESRMKVFYQGPCEISRALVCTSFMVYKKDDDGGFSVLAFAYTEDAAKMICKALEKSE
jgi:hypothetical protein